jgi:hypothetical protein
LLEESDPLEGAVAVAPIEVVPAGHLVGRPATGRTLEDHHEAIGIRERQRSQHDRVHDREQRRGGADGQRQRAHGDQGEARAPVQLPPSEAQILRELVERPSSPHGSRHLSDQQHVPEIAARGSLRLARLHPGFLTQSGFLGQVEADLLVQFLLAAPSAIALCLQALPCARERTKHRSS